MDVPDSPISKVLTYEQVQDNGHDLRFDFILINAAALFSEWTFSRKYFPRCETETYWLLQMTLFRKQSENKILGYASLRRTDSLVIPVLAHFVVEFRHKSLHLEFEPEEPVLKKVLPGEKKQANFSIEPPDDIKDLFDRRIIISISVAVRNCHTKSEVRSSSAGVGVKRKRQRSKV